MAADGATAVGAIAADTMVVTTVAGDGVVRGRSSASAPLSLPAPLLPIRPIVRIPAITMTKACTTDLTITRLISTAIRAKSACRIFEHSSGARVFIRQHQGKS